jgi:hypothetical protein
VSRQAVAVEHVPHLDCVKPIGFSFTTGLPSVIGGSTRSCSFVTTGKYFNDIVRHSSCVVLAWKVVCPKDKHRD